LPDNNVHDILDNGRKAQVELPMVQEAMLEMRNGVVDKLLKAKGDQERKNLVESLQIGKEVVEYLILTIQKADHAKNKLDDIQHIGQKKNIIGKWKP